MVFRQALSLLGAYFMKAQSTATYEHPRYIGLRLTRYMIVSRRLRSHQ